MKAISVAVALFVGLSVFGWAATDDYLLSYTDDRSGEELIGYRTVDGDTVVEAKFFYACDTLRTITTVLEPVGRMYMIDRNGDEIPGLIPFCYADFTPDNEVSQEGVFRFVENNKMGFADLNGHKVIPAAFDFVTPFHEGLAEYALGGQWMPVNGSGEFRIWTGEYESGYINHSGQRFREVGKLKKGKRKAWTIDGKRVHLDESGNVRRGR